MILSPSLRTRIAPTPSGYLHIGNAVSFFLTWCLARKAGGKLILRIDDLDAPRNRPEYIEDIFQQLEWLGIDWDEGPEGPDDFHASHSQRYRLEEYRSGLDRLRARDLLYSCDCSRSQLKRQKTFPRYAGTCRNRKLDLGGEFSWRCQVVEGTPCAYEEFSIGAQQKDVSLEMGDFVVKRRDGIPGYQLTATMNDIRDRVNLVVRGDDLSPSTSAQVYLWPLFTEAKVPTYFHHPLMLGRIGEKFSKSTHAPPIQEMCKNATEVMAIAAQFFGLSEEPQTTSELLAIFPDDGRLSFRKLR